MTRMKGHVSTERLRVSKTVCQCHLPFIQEGRQKVTSERRTNFEVL